VDRALFWLSSEPKPATVISPWSHCAVQHTCAGLSMAAQQEV